MQCQIRLNPSLIKKIKTLSHHSAEHHLRAHESISEGEKLANWGRFLLHHNSVNVKNVCGG